MLMKSADGNNGNCCNTNEDIDTASDSSDIKMQGKKKDPMHRAKMNCIVSF